MIEGSTVDVKNLSFTSANPEGVIAWKDNGDEAQLTVNMDDNDLTDPIALTFAFYLTSMDNSHHTPQADWIITMPLPDGLDGSSYTLILDAETLPVRGLYTYSVTASQTDICNTDPSIQITDDNVRYRSEHVNVRRGLDDYGEPIFRVDYSGCDDKGTPSDPLDDEYAFTLRRYVLSSTDGLVPSEGKLLLYGPGPDLALVKTWNIADLRCTEHSAESSEVKDGLENGTHGLLIRLSPGDIQYGGVYRFVFHVKDAHGPMYRRNANRWVVDLSYAWDQRSATVYVSRDEYMDDTANGQYAYRMLASIYDPNDESYEPGYFGRPPLGDPYFGGSGLCIEQDMNDMLHTLDRLIPTIELDEMGDPKQRWYAYRAAPSAIWAFIGHSTTSWLTLPGGHLAKEGEENTLLGEYSIRNTPGVDYVHLAYLAGCGTAGGRLWIGIPYFGGELFNCPNPGDSLAAAFWEEGADSVVGFRDKLRNTNVFTRFNELFWEGVCKKGLTVAEAEDRARVDLPVSTLIGGWYPEWCDFKMGAKTVVWGGDYYLWDHRLQDGY